MGLMVGRWDCPYCGHVGNLGPDTRCCACAAPRDSDVQFYLPENAEYTNDEEFLKRSEAGADWTCAFCGANVSALKAQCISCGYPREATDTLRQQKAHTLEGVPRSDADTRRTKAPAHAGRKAKRRKIPRKAILGGLVVLSVIGVVLWGIFLPRPTTVSVTGHHWSRSIVIENYREVEDQGWSIPSGGKKIREFRAVHHTEKVLDHYEQRTRSKKVKVGTEKYVCGKIDQGNGLFKDKYCTRDTFEERTEKYKEPIYRNDPVYQTKYVYRIYRWVVHKTHNANGTNTEPYWPEGAPSGDTWREGSRRQKYLLIVKDKKDRFHEFDTSFDTWMKYHIADEIPATMNMAGKVEATL